MFIFFPMCLRMTRSFFYGIIFASATWCFSLYLYWLLVHQQSNAIISHPSQPAIDENIARQDQIARGKSGALKRHTISQSLLSIIITEKLQQWKKEKKFRKISQRLINELKPVISDNSTGKRID